VPKLKLTLKSVLRPKFN